MLIYYNDGLRDYHKKAIPIYHRGVWEIQAVLNGSMWPTFHSSMPTVAPAQQNIWCFSPGCGHGWASPPNQNIEMIVFQFTEVPDVLKTCVERCDGMLQDELSERSVLRLRELGLVAEWSRRKSFAVARLASQQLVNELALLFNDVKSFGEELTEHERIVEQSLAYLSANMHERPKNTELAEAVFCSPAHLRRIFHEVRDCSPQEAFEELRFDRAEEMLRNEHTHASIADACGYADPSTFSRAFKLRYGQSPRDWQESESERQEKERAVREERRKHIAQSRK